MGRRIISFNPASNRRRRRVRTGGDGHDLVKDDVANPTPVRFARLARGRDPLAEQECAAR
jgi:hypothetical protein